MQLLDTRAAAYAENGEFDKAIDACQNVIDSEAAGPAEKSLAKQRIESSNAMKRFVKNFKGRRAFHDENDKATDN